jgi:alkylation response protein AidB-like acyl-CoA dehydrogenase
MSQDHLLQSTLSFDLTEDQQMIQDAVREFTERRVAPTVMDRDQSCAFPHDLVQELSELGLMGMVHPEEYGGADADYVSFALALEELARWDASLSLTVSSHTSLCSGHIALAGTHEQKKKFLTPLASGQLLGAWCLTEPGSGSDASGMKTTAVRDGDQWVINGSKIFITQASVGGIYVVLAVTDKSLGTKGISAFIIERNNPGLKIGPKLHKLGMNSSDTAEVYFEDCRIPADQLLGEINHGFIDTMKVLDSGRIGIAALCVGIARGALEESITYSQERKQFGKAIAQFQAISFKIADMATQVEAARLLTLKAAWLRDNGRPFSKEASMAKLYASELATKASLDAIQIHGGYGYTKEYHVERFLRDAKLLEIGEGTSEVQRMVIGKHVIR